MVGRGDIVTIDNDETTAHLGIIELAHICARMRAVNLDLFGELGAWVRATDAGPLQRRYATACHRHAWHAALWAERSPTIPALDHDTAGDAGRSARLPERPDDDAYRRCLDEMTTELDAIADRLDVDLDPSTGRVLMLVRNDVADLRRD
jgi:hypothetical protein